MSFLRRIWQTLRNPRVYAGRDLEGNHFYEYPASMPDRRTKRVVEYKHSDDVWDYIGGGKRLPAQWSSWLTHTRQYPPTLEELQVDFDRQKRVKMNAALIDARDNENRARLIAEGVAVVEEAQRMTIEQATEEDRTRRSQYHQGPTDGDQKELRDEIHFEQEQTEMGRNSPLKSTDPGQSLWVEYTEDTLKPHPWAPSARRRGK